MVTLEGKKAYTMREAAELLKIGYAAITKAVRLNRIGYLDISGKKLIPEDAIREYTQRTQQKGGQKHE